MSMGGSWRFLQVVLYKPTCTTSLPAGYGPAGVSVNAWSEACWGRSAGEHVTDQIDQIGDVKRAAANIILK